MKERNKTLLDDLKKVVDIEQIERCYYIDIYKEYSVNLDIKATLELLNKIIPNEDTRIIDIIFETNEKRITINPFWSFGDDEDFFESNPLEQPKVITTVKPDTLFDTYQYKIDNEYYDLPIKTNEEKFFDSFNIDDKMMLLKNKKQLDIMKSVNWLQKVAIEIFNNDELYHFNQKTDTNFSIINHPNYKNAFYIQSPKDFDLSLLDKKYIITLIALKKQDDYLKVFDWQDLCLDKDFTKDETIYNKLVRASNIYHYSYDLIDENKDTFSYHPLDEKIDETRKKLFNHLIEKDLMRNAIFVNTEFFNNLETSAKTVKEYARLLVDMLKSIYKDKKRKEI